MGIDNFLIYTNGCEDGTSEILDHLQELGVLQHRNNDDWKGNSPQQYALNQSLEEPVIKNAEWIIHIDVDEFMNVRCGNGTVQEFIAAGINLKPILGEGLHQFVTGLRGDLDDGTHELHAT